MKPKRTRGRPRLDPLGSIRVNVRIGLALYERLAAQARLERCSMSAVLRSSVISVRPK